MNFIKDVTSVDKEQSLESQNRDSAKLMAKKFNQICEDRSKNGTFVFMSAEESIMSS